MMYIPLSSIDLRSILHYHSQLAMDMLPPPPLLPPMTRSSAEIKIAMKFDGEIWKLHPINESWKSTD